MQKRTYRIIPGVLTLLMIFTVLISTTLGMRCFISAKSDLRLSERGSAMTRAYYEATAAGEEHLAKLDLLLADSTDEQDVQLPAWAVWLDKHTIVYYESAGENLAVQMTVQVISKNGRLSSGSVNRKIIPVNR